MGKYPIIPEFDHQTSGKNEIWRDIDIITKRPRTPNYPYTDLNDKMIANIQKKSRSAPFFMSTKLENQEKPEAERDNQNSSCLFNKEFEENLLTRETAYMQKRFAKPHHTDSVNRNLVRIETKAPFCFIKQQKSKDYDNCRGLASVKWGPNKSGEATRSHTFGEDVERYTMIDMQRRNPTNYSGRVVMDCGRPGDGYYAEKFPSRTTWFGSNVPLNRQFVLPSVYRKTASEYDTEHMNERIFRERSSEKWPHMTEYTDRYLLYGRSGCPLSG